MNIISMKYNIEIILSCKHIKYSTTLIIRHPNRFQEEKMQIIQSKILYTG